MNRFTLCFVSLSFFTQSFAQNESYLHNRYILERMGTQGTVANGVPIGNFLGPPPGVVGDVYLHHDYRNAGFILYGNEKVVSRIFPPFFVTDCPRMYLSVQISAICACQTLPV